MNLYQQEFGKYFELGFNLNDYPFLTDKSYRNDICPSFYFKTAGTYYILWVDYPTPSERENENFSRYTIVEAKNIESGNNPELQTCNDSEVNIQIESAIEIIHYLNNEKCELRAK